jgi:hypothetical protein
MEDSILMNNEPSVDGPIPEAANVLCKFLDFYVDEDVNYPHSQTILECTYRIMFCVVVYSRLLLPALVVLLLGFWLGNVYIKVQLAVKREMANAKSPILGIVGSAINGLGTSYDISEY